MQSFTDFQSSKTYSKASTITITLYTGELFFVLRTFKSNNDATSCYSYLNSSSRNPDQLIELCKHHNAGTTLRPYKPFLFSNDFLYKYTFKISHVFSVYICSIQSFLQTYFNNVYLLATFNRYSPH
jgi:hypothetical protein